MSVTQLKQWMDKNRKSVVDVASAIKVDPITIKRFLKRGKSRPIVEAALENLVKTSPTQPEAEAATG